MKRSEWADAWYQQALHDFQAARVLHRQGFWDSCVYMCEQAAEKALKGLWTDLKPEEPPPRTHRVNDLAEELGAPQDVVDAASGLAGDYATSRYPGPSPVPPFRQYRDSEALRGIARAQMVFDWAAEQWEIDSDEEEAD